MTYTYSNSNHTQYHNCTTPIPQTIIPDPPPVHTRHMPPDNDLPSSTETHHSMESTQQKSYNRLTTIRLMTNAANTALQTNATYQLHIDGGANRSITNDSSILLNYRNIKPYTMSGVNKDEAAIICTGIGYLPWRAPDGATLLVKCYYSSNAADTIISPSDIVLNHISNFSAWTQHSNLVTGTGYIDLLQHDGHRTRYPLYHNNGLWYYHTEGFIDYDPNNTSHVNKPIIK